MTHLYEYLSGSDETIQKYIENCGREEAFDAPVTISLSISDVDELVATLAITESAARTARSAFISAVHAARSTEAQYHALAFRIQQVLRGQLLQIAEQQQGAKWVERWIDDPSTFHLP